MSNTILTPVRIRELNFGVLFTALRALEKQEKIKKYKKKSISLSLFFFLFSFVFSYFFQAAEGVILIPNSRCFT